VSLAGLAEGEDGPVVYHQIAGGRPWQSQKLWIYRALGSCSESARSGWLVLRQTR
jgi:hypothetical protein